MDYKTTSSAAKRFAVVAACVLAPMVASGQVVERSLEEFLAAQGTYCFPLDFSNPDAGCGLFHPPLPNMLAWEDSDTGRCAFLDYPGFANDYLFDATVGAVDLGTSFTGRVTERSLQDGTAEITVALETDNALAWVQESCSVGTAPVVLFGRTVTEVAGGAASSTGTARMHLRFIMPAPGQPLPDLAQVAWRPGPYLKLDTLTFTAQVTGELRSGLGVPDGMTGKLTIVNQSVWRPGGAGATPFPAQIILLK